MKNNQIESIEPQTVVNTLIINYMIIKYIHYDVYNIIV